MVICVLISLFARRPNALDDYLAGRWDDHRRRGAGSSAPESAADLRARWEQSRTVARSITNKNQKNHTGSNNHKIRWISKIDN